MKKYTFEDVTNCEMCGDPTGSHKILGQRLNTSQGFNPKSKEGITVTIKKCSNCDLIYSSPQPIPNDIQDHYGTPPEEYWQPSYFTWEDSYFSREIQIAKEILKFKPGMRALDIGAGLGKAMISMEKAGFETYGFEPSKPFYERAISRMGISPDKLKLGMIEEVEYPEASFDFISFGAVFEHLYHPSNALKKALRWLRPNGLIQIEVPSSNHLIPKFLNLYYRLRGTNYVTHLSPMHSPFHLYEFGEKSFKELSQKLGFTVTKTEYLVCDINPIPKFLHPLLRWYMNKTNTGMQLVVWIIKK